MRTAAQQPTSLLALATALLPSLAHSHGLISTPAARAPGAATTAACGPKIAAEIASDPTSHVEGLPELGLADGTAFDPSLCNVWLCKGLQFADNEANVQTYAPGEVVPIVIDLAIPHVGSANVSIVDTASNVVLGEPLVEWASGYADEREFYAGTTPVDQTDFSVTIPEDLEGSCAEPGACVIQWWWYGTGARQTYESCVDFVVSEA